MLNFFFRKRGEEAAEPCAPAAVPAVSQGTLVRALEGSDDDYFSAVTEREALVALFRRLQTEHAEIELLAYGMAQSLPTRVTAYDPLAGTVSVLAHPDLSDRAAVVAAGGVHLSFDDQGEITLLSLDCVGLEQVGDVAYYRLVFPAWALTIQFRRYPRIRLHYLNRNHAALKAFLGTDKLPKINDISEGGVSMQIPATQWHRVVDSERAFSMADVSAVEQNATPVTMRVRHVRPASPQDVSVGAEFVGLSKAQERELRRVMLQLQARSQSG